MPVLHIVSHTHWDREWYQPFELFRLRLVDLIDHLLLILRHDPGFLHFHLDSQCIVLEDYLEVRPERERELREHIGSGRIEVGPWYVLNDTFLTSGEATIRNLLLGRRIARRFGGRGGIGYLPDQFGSIGQLPQIFNGFGLAVVVVGRGIGVADVPLEFVWRSPDGSSVLTSFLHGWYNNAQRLSEVPARAAEQLRQAVAHLMPYAKSRHLLLMNGVDHLEPQENLSPILRAVRPLLGPWEVRHGSLGEYFAALREDLVGSEVTTWTGELRQQWHRHSILNGTLSSRMYLKLDNHRCQLLLERWAEPWSAITGLLGEEVPSSQLGLAWRHLLRNHPHDSICGCSVDAVHQDMLFRFAHSRQVSQALLRRAQGWVCRRIRLPAPENDRTRASVVFNATSHQRDGLCTLTFDFPPAEAGERLRLCDATTGTVIPFHLVERQRAQSLPVRPTELPRSVESDRFTVRAFVRDLPPFGYRTCVAERIPGPRFVYGSERPPQDEGLSAEMGADSLGAALGGQNEHLRLRLLRDGTFTLASREGGGKERVFSGLGLLWDDGEAGDEYLHEPPAGDRTVVGLACPVRIMLTEYGPDWLAWSVRGNLRVPRGLTADRRARDTQEVDIPVEMMLTLVRGSRRLEVEVCVDNRACDHRLRMLFPTGRVVEAASAAGQFDVVRRPSTPPLGWEAHGNHPAEHFVDCSDGDGGIAVLLDGTPEYAVVPTGSEHAIAITLLRCTDIVGDNAGFELAPEGQCQGPIRLRLALIPHHGDWVEAELHREVEEFQLPPEAVQRDRPLSARRLVPVLSPDQIVSASSNTSLPNPFEPPSPVPDLPPAHSFLRVEGRSIVVSTFKPAEDGQGMILRLYNPSEEDARAAIRLDRPIERAEICDLAEEKGSGVLPIDAHGMASCPVGAKRIVTIRLVPTERGGTDCATGARA